METVTFHEGNGWNYKVKTTEKRTYIERYYTNGHNNSTDEVRGVNHVEIPKTHIEAEALYIDAVQNGFKSKIRL